MAKSSVTIREVAQAAGVSRATAQHALAGTGRIADTTREKVKRIAADLGYRPNRLASYLRRQRSCTVGVVVTTINSPVFSAVVDGVTQVLREADHIPLLGCSNGDPALEVELVEALLESAVDGLIVLPAHPTANASYYQRLVEEGIPLVFVIRSMPEVNADWVCNDNERSGCLLAQHLANVGRKRLAFLTQPYLLETSSAIRERLEGCNRTLSKLSLPAAQVLGPEYPEEFPGERFALHVIGDQVKRGLEWDGLVAAHDGLAYGALGALAQAGIAVPQQVGVVGCDDLYASECWNPPLTTVRQQADQIGVQAARVLLERASSVDDGPSPYRHIRLQPTLVVRGSCGADTTGSSCQGGRSVCAGTVSP